MVLKDLCALRGATGTEGDMRDYIAGKIRALGIEPTYDRMGNVYARKNARGGAKKHVLLEAHMDEVGFLVLGINDDGLLSYAPLGSIDARVVVSKRVTIGEKRVPGVIGAKAIHLQTREEMERVLEHKDLFIDIGAKDKASAEKLVEPGDTACFESEWREFGEGLVKARALDDRIGCATLLRVLEGEYPVDVTCAFTVQEEIGMRGAMVAGNVVKPDCALVIECTSANDLGKVPEHLRVCRVGGGVAISFMDHRSIAHPGLFSALEEVADNAGIKWQIKSFVSGGNDAGALQTARGALPTCVLSVPCRYIHSPSSVAGFDDIETQFALARAYLLAGAPIKDISGRDLLK